MAALWEWEECVVVYDWEYDQWNRILDYDSRLELEYRKPLRGAAKQKLILL